MLQTAAVSTAIEKHCDREPVQRRATAAAGYAFSSKLAVETDRIVKLSDTAAGFGGSRKLDALDGQPQVVTYYSRTSR